MLNKIYLKLAFIIASVHKIFVASEESGSNVSLGYAEGYEEKIIVLCGKQKIVVSIPTLLLYGSGTTTPVDPENVLFQRDASEQCRAKVQDENTYTMTINLESNFLCGTTVKEIETEIEYSNEIVWLDSTSGSLKSLLNLTCLFVDGEDIYVLPHSTREAELQSENNEPVKTKIELYRDKSFESSALYKDISPSISVGQFVYVSIATSSGGKNNIAVLTRNCFASFYSKPTDRRIVHNFIINGCANKKDPTVKILQNGNLTYSWWRFQMFKWMDAKVQRIYLFCEVQLCNEECKYNLQQQKNCFGNPSRRFKRHNKEIKSNSSSTKFVMLAAGPIFPKDSIILQNAPEEKEDGTDSYSGLPDESNEVVPVAVGVAAGACVVILIVGTIVMYRKHWKKKNLNKEKDEKNEIEQGFAFVIRSSNDQNLYNNQEIKDKNNINQAISDPDKVGGQSFQQSQQQDMNVQNTDRNKVACIKTKKKRSKSRRHNSKMSVKRPSSGTRSEHHSFTNAST